MSEPKRHHYVPRFYLEYFTSAKGTFWVYDKAGDLPRHQTPKNTAVEGYFYSITKPSGEKEHSLEKALAQLESIAKPILDRWQTAKARPTKEEIGNIVHFLAFMHSRVPRNVDAVKQILEAVYVEELKHFAGNEEQFGRSWDEFCGRQEKLGKPVSMSFEEALKTTREVEDHFKIEMDEKVALAFSFEQASIIPHFLVQMNWCLCEAPGRHFFVTSDSPLVIFDPIGDGRAVFGAGLGLPGAEVTFPISPAVCLQIDRCHTQRRRRVSQEFVREVNRRRAHATERYVISHIKTKKVDTLVHDSAWTYGHTKIDREEIRQRYSKRKRDR